MGPRHWDDDVSSESLASSNNENTSEWRGAENWPSVRRGSLASRWTSTNITSQDYNLIPAGPLTFNLHTPTVPCSTIFATKCNRIHLSGKDSWDFKTKTKSFLCLICILFRNTTSDGFISMPSKERNDHLFRAFSSIWGHLLFVMTWTWHWRFTSERQMLYKRDPQKWNLH